MKKKLVSIILVYIPAGAVFCSILLVLLLKWIPVRYTPLMMKRSLHSIGRTGVPVNDTGTVMEDI